MIFLILIRTHHTYSSFGRHIHHDVVRLDFTRRLTIHINIIIVTHACNGLVQIIVYRFVYNMWSHFCCRRSIQWDFQYLHSDGSGLLNHHHDYHEREQSEMSLKKEMGKEKMWTFAENVNGWERERKPVTLMGSILFCDNMFGKTSTHLHRLVFLFHPMDVASVHLTSDFFSYMFTPKLRQAFETSLSIYYFFNA